MFGLKIKRNFFSAKVTVPLARTTWSPDAEHIAAANKRDDVEEFVKKHRTGKEQKAPNQVLSFIDSYERKEIRKRHWSGKFQVRFNAALTKGDGASAIEASVGYTMAELKRHLQRQFLKGMNWSNYGVCTKNKKWVIDHIVPKSTFGANEVAACYALTNLRPSWSQDNVRKGTQRTLLV